MFEFNRFKKVLDSAGQSEYHTLTPYTSKIKTLNATVCFARNRDHQGCLPNVIQSLKFKILHLVSVPVPGPQPAPGRPKVHPTSGEKVNLGLLTRTV